KKNLFPGSAAEVFHTKLLSQGGVDQEHALASRGPDLVILPAREAFQIFRGGSERLWLAIPFNPLPELIEDPVGEAESKPSFRRFTQGVDNLFSIEPQRGQPAIPLDLA